MSEKAEVRDALDSEKMEFFEDRVTELAQKLAIEAYVMLVSHGDIDRVVRYPMCSPKCDDHDGCAVKVLRNAGEMLIETAGFIEKEAKP